jgi:HNH endonuclease
VSEAEASLDWIPRRVANTKPLVCVAPDCDYILDTKCSLNMCNKHYYRFKKHGDFSANRYRTMSPEKELQICEMYQDGASARSIGLQLDFSPTHVRNILDRNNIPVRKQIGPNHASWKGGRIVNPDGYVTVKVEPENHFYSMAGRRGGRSYYVLEHRLIMAQKLRRPLLRNEHVHHINGVRDDNRPDNLELWVTSQPKGQRVTDKVAWAKDLLALYEPEALATKQEEKLSA